LSTATLEFQHAYAQNLEVIDYTDSLLVYISDDCGDTWTRIYSGGEDGTGNFATHEPTGYDFFPEVVSDWCMQGWGAPCITLDISEWAGNADVQVAFETYSYFGNPIFIDNVSVTQTVGQSEISLNKQEIRVYPNPTNGSFTIVLPINSMYNNLSVTNHLGQVIYNQNITESENRIKIDESSTWNSGVYFVRLNGDIGSNTKKIIIK